MSTKAVLSAPLPRVYEETHAGKVVPLNASQASGAGGQQGVGQVVMPIGGTDFNAEELAKISKETSKKIESEVLAPMERWMNAYNLVQVRTVEGGCMEWVWEAVRGCKGVGPAGVLLVGQQPAQPSACRPPRPSPAPPTLPTLALTLPCPPALQNRMNKLESLRLEVDSRRRTVGKLGKKVRGHWVRGHWLWRWLCCVQVGAGWVRRPGCGGRSSER
jgi:hypothetical protein